MENIYSLLLFGSKKNKYFTQSLQELKIQELTLQKSLKEDIQIKTILVKNRTLDKTIFEEIKEELTDNIILLNIMFSPDENWLFSLIKTFHEQPINLLTGDVINSDLFPKFLQKKSNCFSSQIQHIFNNCMVNKILLEKILLYLYENANSKELWVYDRLLMEIEAEIIYHDNIKVIKRS